MRTSRWDPPIVSGLRERDQEVRDRCDDDPKRLDPSQELDRASVGYLQRDPVGDRPGTDREQQYFEESSHRVQALAKDEKPDTHSEEPTCEFEDPERGPGQCPLKSACRRVKNRV